MVPITLNYLYCHLCGKTASTGFNPSPTDTPDKGLILRAIVICPECVETKIKFVDDLKRKVRKHK